MTALMTGPPSAASALRFKLPQDERGDLGRREGLLAELDLDYGFAAFRDAERKQLQFLLHIGDAAAHQALDGVDGAVGMIDQFLPGGVADDDLAGLMQRNDAGDKLVAILAVDHFGNTELHVGDEAVGGAEVDADDGYW